MKYLITGANGMLAHDLILELNNPDLNLELFTFTKEELDITNQNALEKKVNLVNPDVIINCAAYTNVDGAEDEKELCFEINSYGVKKLALICSEKNISLVQISTDYVFDGKKGSPYETDDKTNPINVYGKSKEKGEEFITSLLNKFFIIRTSWLYGKNGKNFVDTMINLSKSNKELKIVSDQIGSPTWTKDLSKAIKFIISKNVYGIYHVSNSETCTWKEFAEEIFNIIDANIKVYAQTTEERGSKALRPKYSVMSHKKINELGYYLPSWKNALNNYLVKYAI